MPRHAIVEAPSALGHVPEHLGVERAPAVLLGAGLADSLVLVAGCSSAAARPSPARTACGTSFRPGVMRKLRNVVTVMRQTYQIPGVAVAVIVPGQGCWVSASGVANAAEGAPLTLTDAFPIGSITKTFTATVILQLVQQGKLSLSAPVSRWVPYVGDRGVAVTIDAAPAAATGPDAATAVPAAARYRGRGRPATRVRARHLQPGRMARP